MTSAPLAQVTPADYQETGCTTGNIYGGQGPFKCGHPRTPENVYVAPADRRQYCKECRRAADRRHKDKNLKYWRKSHDRWAKCIHPRTPENSQKTYDRRKPPNSVTCRTCFKATRARHRSKPETMAKHYEGVKRYKATAKGVFARARGRLNQSIKNHAAKLIELETLLNG